MEELEEELDEIEDLEMLEESNDYKYYNCTNYIKKWAQQFKSFIKQKFNKNK